MKWWLLALAIGTEVTAALCLDLALEEPVFLVPVVLGYVTAFACLAGILRLGEQVGVAYAVWAATGVALTAVLSVVLLGDEMPPVVGGGIALVIAGVLLVELGAPGRGGSRSGGAP